MFNVAQVFVGTSGWAYKAWQPGFYPEKLPQKQYLRHYASRLTAVEVNYTFRRLLSEKTISNWLAETPEHFQFALKANQAITHYKRLKNAEEAVQRFLSSVAPLAQAGRLGPVLFQLPPQMKAAPAVLDEFLGMLPRSLRSAFEFRDAGWFSSDTYDVLQRHSAALCIAENESLVTPEVLTAGFCYYRFRRPDYSLNERTQIAERIRRHAEGGREVYAFFKHEESPESPLYAVELLQSVQARAA